MAAARTKRGSLGRERLAELEVARGEGSFLFDTQGIKYIDFLMGSCVGNLGWAHPALTRRIERFRGPDYVYPGHAYRGWTELARLLASIASGRLSRCFRATGGSEAVDLALQAAMIHTGRRRFLSLESSYHGNSIAALSIGSSYYRSSMKNLLPRCDKIPAPLDARALEKIERRLKRRDVAAFIMEPIVVNLGVLIPGQGVHEPTSSGSAEIRHAARHG